MSLGSRGVGWHGEGPGAGPAAVGGGRKCARASGLKDGPARGGGAREALACAAGGRGSQVLLVRLGEGREAGEDELVRRAARGVGVGSVCVRVRRLR